MKYDIAQHSKKANEARNKKLTPEERSLIARKAAKARWGNKENSIEDNIIKHECDGNCFCRCGRKKEMHVELHHEFECQKKL